ncbi:MAG: hypothetical protein ACRDHV_06805 [Actinomycetota bacterium]
MRQGRTDIREVVLVLFGLVIGILVGLLVGPALRSWLAWREYVEAGREARLHEEIMRRMGPDRPSSQWPRPALS